MHSKTFFIGDTHFFHKRIIEFNGIKAFRPFATIEEHNEELVKRWNSVVRPHDKVYHLGDFCFGGYSNISIAARLDGKKILIMGNHDHYAATEYLKYFDKILGCTEYKGGLLSHMPVHESQLKRYKFNVHGHLHSNNIERAVASRFNAETGEVEGYFENDPRYINVSCEQVNLTPIESAALLKDYLTTKGE